MSDLGDFELRLLLRGIRKGVSRCRFVLGLLFLLTYFSGSVFGQRLERWVYAPANLLVPENVDRLEQLMREAAGLGFTHLLLSDSRFSRLHEMDERYFRHVERVRKLSDELQLRLVPAVFPVGYSNDLLAQNPNLAEGLPVRNALFEVRGDRAELVADPAVSLPSLGDRKSWNFVDEALRSEGNGLRAEDPQGENCRAMKTVRVAPFRHYHVSVRVKTLDFRGQPQITVLDATSGRRLSHTNLRVGRTSDWTIQHITFNSLSSEEVHVYLGAWGPTGGSFWLSDAQMEECGLLNVLRRNGAPLKVIQEHQPEVALREGVDFEPVSDPLLGRVPYGGEYEVWHASPAIRLKRSFPAGSRLRVSWFHPHVIYDGQVCACVTEPAFQQLLRGQADDVERAFPGTDRMMSHDEWRVLGWDESFQRTGKTAGQVVADNVRFCTDYLKTLRRDRRVFVWSDMFDPHHNAVDNYYLVNGDLSGSWEGLSRDVVVVNWNFGVRDESLKFFAERGHRQLLAGYYDADAQQIGRWLDTVRSQRIEGVVGVMYTTWKQDYSHLREFAEVVNRYEGVVPRE
jgi:hypothetical protein